MRRSFQVLFSSSRIARAILPAKHARQLRIGNLFALFSVLRNRTRYLSRRLDILIKKRKKNAVTFSFRIASETSRFAIVKMDGVSMD